MVLDKVLEQLLASEGATSRAVGVDSRQRSFNGYEWVWQYT